jgi:hypothetical protein
MYKKQKHKSLKHIWEFRVIQVTQLSLVISNKAMEYNYAYN